MKEITEKTLHPLVPDVFIAAIHVLDLTGEHLCDHCLLVARLICM
jgi:hypothetical protein